MTAMNVKKIQMSEKKISRDLAEIDSFLGAQTPEGWLQHVAENLDLLLVDHANCEKKAASTALSLLYKYVDRQDLLEKLSRLAREELRHFEQVLAIMKRKAITYRHVGPSGYAAALMKEVRSSEPNKLIDTLIVGAFIEARSCERFAAMIPVIEEYDGKLAEFYFSLLRSEARHYQDYLKLAERYALEADGEESLAQRIDHFRSVEAGLILANDKQFRFHSGVYNPESH